jgi:pyruvate-formate lyase-activating enzyme
MTTKAAIANGASKEEAKYLPLIDKYLAEIKAIHKDIVRKRTAGRKITARIDRNLKEIQATLDRVAATH